MPLVLLSSCIKKTCHVVYILQQSFKDVTYSLYLLQQQSKVTTVNEFNVMIMYCSFL